MNWAGCGSSINRAHCRTGFYQAVISAFADKSTRSFRHLPVIWIGTTHNSLILVI
jgi:hypothetical protein